MQNGNKIYLLEGRILVLLECISCLIFQVECFYGLRSLPGKKSSPVKDVHSVFSITEPLPKTLDANLAWRSREAFSTNCHIPRWKKKKKKSELMRHMSQSYNPIGKLNQSYNSCYNPRHSFLFPSHRYMWLASKCSYWKMFFLRLWLKTLITQDEGCCARSRDVCMLLVDQTHKFLWTPKEHSISRNVPIYLFSKSLSLVLSTSLAATKQICLDTSLISWKHFG